MIRLPLCARCLALLALVPLHGRAGESKAPAKEWVVDRAMTLSPAPSPVPALRYRLFPLYTELKEGNAVPIYLRLVHEQNDAARKYRAETPLKWNALPVDEIPLDEARKFLTSMGRFRRQIELGARRKTVDWSYTLDEGSVIGILLPDAQNMRNYGPTLVLQARVALVEKNFDLAAHHLETGLAFSRHMGEGPFLINGLVGIALASQFSDVLLDFVERPGAPNLYWSLASLPRPLIDLRRGMDLEYPLLTMEFPELADLDSPRPTEEWDAVLRRLRIAQRSLAKLDGRPLPDREPEAPATKSPELPAARSYVARIKGLTPEKVEAMPAAQVLLQYIVGTWHDMRDEVFKGVFLPFPQAFQVLAEAAKRQSAAPASEAKDVGDLLLPALAKVLMAQARLERRLATVRAIEALRMYAAAHDGELPDKLADVTEAPVPDDPGTGKPFEYSKSGATATLTSRVPGAAPPGSGLRYRLTMRKN